MALIPWLIALAAELPATATARHWGAAWAGLDAMEAIGLLATGVLLARRDERATLAAMATATLLIADAWLDVMTAPAAPARSPRRRWPRSASCRWRRCALPWRCGGAGRLLLASEPLERSPNPIVMHTLTVCSPPAACGGAR